MLEVDRPDVAFLEGDFFNTSDFQPLAFFDGLHEIRRLQQRGFRAGVKPGESASELFDVQLAAFDVCAIDVGDLQFAASGWF